MSVSEFTMIRHGQTVDNIKGRLQGHHDSPLDATGLAQANQNHRLSRWYAPRLQGVCTGSPIRALNDSPCATSALPAQMRYRKANFGVCRRQRVI